MPKLKFRNTTSKTFIVTLCLLLMSLAAISCDNDKKNIILTTMLFACMNFSCDDNSNNILGDQDIVQPSDPPTLRCGELNHQSHSISDVATP